MILILTTWNMQSRGFSSTGEPRLHYWVLLDLHQTQGLMVTVLFSSLYSLVVNYAVGYVEAPLDLLHCRLENIGCYMILVL